MRSNDRISRAKAGRRSLVTYFHLHLRSRPWSHLAQAPAPHRLHRLPASPSAIHELLPLIPCSSGRVGGDYVVGWLHSLSVRACRLREAPVHPAKSSGEAYRRASTHPQHRQLISLVFTIPRRACDMHTSDYLINPPNGPSHGAKPTPTIRPTPKAAITHHTHASRLPPVPRKLPSLFCARIRATCDCPLLTCRVG